MTIHLVHGAWHGRWCWKQIVENLEPRRHRVVAKDLPGLGEDTTPAAEITLERYTQAVCDALVEEDEPVLLVGHSMGGIVISQAAERHPDRVKRLVYVSGYLLCDGQSMMQMVQEDEDLARLAGLLISDGTVCTFPEDKPREIFYNNCAVADADWASSMLVPQPVAPLLEPVHVTGERFGRIPRYYVQCLQDRALPLTLQNRMLAATPCENVVSIDTDHSPFLSTPEVFLDTLLSFCA
jgi:pimeloyl-ACP methyl ester carboxylesterase